MLLDAGVPWWVFLMMPLMMLGMGLMMWLMMRMMMGMDHSGTHVPPERGRSPGEQVAGSEVDLLRRQVAELQERLAAMEGGSRRETSGSEKGEEQ
jgi:hypothetical protein